MAYVISVDSERDCSDEKTSGLSAKINSLIKQQAEKADEVYKRAIDKVLGDEWSISDLEGRVDRVRPADSKCETLFLDGVPILEISDPEYSFEGTTARLTAQYRILV